MNQFCVCVCASVSRLPVCLVDLHVAVELLQLLFKQLQVGVDEAELQSHCLLHLVVGGCPAEINTDKLKTELYFDCDLRKRE